jgi:hypothetical protein
MTLYPSTTTPPQTTAIYGDFKKSTAISKGYNVGLRYIKVRKPPGLLGIKVEILKILYDVRLTVGYVSGSYRAVNFTKQRSLV